MQCRTIEGATMCSGSALQHAGDDALAAAEAGAAPFTPVSRPCSVTSASGLLNRC